MKSLGVCYWYVKMPWCGCKEHGLKYIMFYGQKHKALLVPLFWYPTGLLGAPAFVKLPYSLKQKLSDFFRK